uniref:Coat protein n=1 Tax=Toxocara canis TaxID=6265 RepID=A0A183U6W6_TOXCA
LDADRRRTSERPTVNSVFAANSTEASNATDVRLAMFFLSQYSVREVTTANLKWRYARSADASRAKQTFDTDLISQSVYVLDSEDESTVSGPSIGDSLKITVVVVDVQLMLNNVELSGAIGQLKPSH